jgi:phosphoribosylanthranilate isomerase
VPVRAKICGLTVPEDAEAAAKAGASYLGVVFAGGPRCMTVTAAAGIVAAGGPIPVFGVFSNQGVEEILRISDKAGLRGAQLHGPYAAGVGEALRQRGLLVWRVVRVATAADLDRLENAAHAADAVLVEPMVPHALGGAGVPLDLSIAQQARDRLAGRTMVLAGGLTPTTVGHAVALVRPEVVDVSSGVEDVPGKKDSEKIARFMEAVFGHSAIS